MTAITLPYTQRHPRGMTRRRSSRALPASVYWRRRVTVLLLIAGAFLAGGKALGALGGGPLTAAEVRLPSPAVTASAEPPATHSGPKVRLVARPVSKATYVVQSGDTLWSIARSLQPEGDIRSVVDALAASRHGRTLQPGERIVLP